MRQRMTPHTVLDCPRQPESVLAEIENFISWEVLRLFWETSGQIDSHLSQDLKQEAMLFVHGLL